MHAHDTAMRADAVSGRGRSLSGVEPTTQWEIAFINYWPLMMFVNSGYLTKVTTELSSRYTLRYIVMNWKHVEMADSTCIQTLEQRLGDMRNIVKGAQMIIVDPNQLVMGILYDYAKVSGSLSLFTVITFRANPAHHLTRSPPRTIRK